MRTIQEKYKGIKEGMFSKDQFVRDARLQHPNWITQFTSYNDAVTIFKNKGVITEEAKPKDKSPEIYRPEVRDVDKYSFEDVQRGIQCELELMMGDTIKDVTEEDYDKAKSKAISNLGKHRNHYLNKLAGKSETKKVTDREVPYKKSQEKDTDNEMKKVQLKEAFKKIIKGILTEGK